MKSMIHGSIALATAHAGCAMAGHPQNGGNPPPQGQEAAPEQLVTTEEPRFIEPPAIEPPFPLACVVPGTQGVMTRSIAVSLGRGDEPFAHVTGTIVRAYVGESHGEPDIVVDVVSGTVRLRGHARIPAYANMPVILSGTWMPGPADALVMRASAPGKLRVDSPDWAGVPGELELLRPLEPEWVGCDRVRVGRGAFARWDLPETTRKGRLTRGTILTKPGGVAIARLTPGRGGPDVDILDHRRGRTQVAIKVGEGLVVGWIPGPTVVPFLDAWGHMWNDYSGDSRSTRSIQIGRSGGWVCPHDVALHVDDGVKHPVVGFAEAGTELLLEQLADPWMRIRVDVDTRSAELSASFDVRAAEVAGCRVVPPESW